MMRLLMRPMEIDMDQSRPFIFASKDLCYDANPALWNVFCALTGRRIGEPNYVWTEQDVIVFMLARGLNNDAGTNDSDHEQTGSQQSGCRYDIRRDVSTGNVMAVGKLRHSDDAVVFVIGA